MHTCHDCGESIRERRPHHVSVRSGAVGAFGPHGGIPTFYRKVPLCAPCAAARRREARRGNQFVLYLVLGLGVAFVAGAALIFFLLFLAVRLSH
jgi:hypothetical protein